MSISFLITWETSNERGYVRSSTKGEETVAEALNRIVHEWNREQKETDGPRIISSVTILDDNRVTSAIHQMVLRLDKLVDKQEDNEWDKLTNPET